LEARAARVKLKERKGGTRERLEFFPAADVTKLRSFESSTIDQRRAVP
jgi:hypothetical protein